MELRKLVHKEKPEMTPPIVIKLNLKVEGIDQFLYLNPELDPKRFYILQRKTILEDGSYLSFKGIPFKYPSQYFSYTTLMLN